MKKYTINLFLESFGIFMYYVVQGVGLLCLNGLIFLSVWSPHLCRKWRLLSNKVVQWFNDNIGC